MRTVKTELTWLRDLIQKYGLKGDPLDLLLDLEEHYHPPIERLAEAEELDERAPPARRPFKPTNGTVQGTRNWVVEARGTKDAWPQSVEDVLDAMTDDEVLAVMVAAQPKGRGAAGTAVWEHCVAAAA